MERNDWKYEVRLVYQHGDQHHDGIKMHFNNLADATRKVLSISSQAFMATSDTGSYVTGPIAKAEIVAAQTGLPELQVRLKSTDDSDPDIIPGLYYIFANGIEDFERKSGLSFSQYKGYNPQLANILVAYSVNEMGARIKNSLAHAELQKATNNHLRNESFYRLELTHKRFGDGEQRTRSVDVTPSVEAFYYTNVDDAIRDLLTVDFNKLNEYVAWEDDMKGFYSSAVVYKKEDIIANLFVEMPAFVHLPRKNIAPGIYLELPHGLERDGITLPLKNLTNVTKVETNLSVSKYIDAMGRTKRAPELEAILDSISTPRTTIKVTAAADKKSNPGNESLSQKQQAVERNIPNKKQMPSPKRKKGNRL